MWKWEVRSRRCCIGKQILSMQFSNADPNRSGSIALAFDYQCKIHLLAYILIHILILYATKNYPSEQLSQSKNVFGTSGPQTAKLSSPAGPYPIGV